MGQDQVLGVFDPGWQFVGVTVLATLFNLIELNLGLEPADFAEPSY